MSNPLPDFESIYAGEPVMEGQDAVPWNIGEPQPAIAALIDGGEVSSDVLDAGCGVGDTTLYLASQGYTAVGVDVSSTAVGRAREAAESRGLVAEFQVADVTALSGCDGRFSTVIDSTLFHSMPVEAREDYLTAIARCAAPGAVLHILVFSREAPFPEGNRPNSVDEQELRDAVSPHWTIDRITPTSIAALTPESMTAHLEKDQQGRSLLPAYLLAAHLPA